jgi:RES domain-containing protein
MPGRRVHDGEILDILEALDLVQRDLPAWRTVRTGRDPLRGSVAAGRWSPPGEFEVLYTSEQEAGSLAEIGYRLMLEPVWPSKISHDIHRLQVRLERVLDLSDFATLQRLLIDERSYEGHNYQRTWEVAAAARFLEADGIIVPNARHPSSNLVVFVDRAADDSVAVLETRPVDWSSWRKANRGKPSRTA